MVGVFLSVHVCKLTMFIGTELFSEPDTSSLLLLIKLTSFAVKTHAWVNAELMMDSCMIGLLVKEPRAY